MNYHKILHKLSVKNERTNIEIVRSFLFFHILTKLIFAEINIREINFRI